MAPFPDTPASFDTLDESDTPPHYYPQSHQPTHNDERGGGTNLQQAKCCPILQTHKWPRSSLLAQRLTTPQRKSSHIRPAPRTHHKKIKGIITLHPYTPVQVLSTPHVPKSAHLTSWKVGGTTQGIPVTLLKSATKKKTMGATGGERIT